MLVERVRCFSVNLPLTTGKYEMSHDRVLSEVESTILELTATDGTVAYSETCTLGANYIDGFARTVRAAVQELLPDIFETDVMHPLVLNQRMDSTLVGHRPGKSLIDAAFWDLRGKILGQPVYNLIGGPLQESFAIFYVVSMGDPGAMALDAAQKKRDGYRAWQLKLGNHPVLDAQRVNAVCEAIDDANDFVTCDGNRGWRMGDATRFIAALGVDDVYVEQPVYGMREMSQLRSRTLRPFVADEMICTVADLVECFVMGACDAVNIKPARVGGITRAAQIRDLAVELGLKVMIDDPFGGEISVGPIAHLAASTRPEAFLAASHLPATYMSRDDQPWVVGGGVPVKEGRGYAPDVAGLGINVDPAQLGEPLFDVTVT
jgi:L-alanine-DL-glutamate epimerase-like enolase superfamily enzyme